MADSKHVWLIICPEGDLHPQAFQAGRAEFGAYSSRQEARLEAARADVYFPGHRVVKFVPEGGR